MRPCRGAWCYGAPGIASALWAASEVLRDGDLCDLAVEAVLAVHRRPAGARNIDSPTACHGTAGLLQVTRRLAASSGDSRLRSAADRVLESVLDAEEPGSIMGYRNREPGGWPVDHPGLLDGSVGVLLALLDVTADTGWDRVLLLG
jgi:lantibiotic biosynthesis protein